MAINKRTKINSRSNKQISKEISIKINTVFIKIPITIENKTNPCLYSFLRGLKYVLIKSGSENN